MADRFQVAENFIAEKVGGGDYTHQSTPSSIAPWVHQPDWVVNPSGDNTSARVEGAQRRGMRLDDLLRNHQIWAVDVLRVHVLGRELSVLQSAHSLFQAGAIAAVVVAIFGPDDEDAP